METQRTIAKWAEETFSLTIEQIATRMLCESAELLLSAHEYPAIGQLREEMIGECADVGIMLLQVAEKLGVRADMIASEAQEVSVDVLTAVMGLNHELVRLTAGIVGKGPEKPLQDQCAFCAYLLWNVGRLLGRLSLMGDITAKMKKNRARVWAKSEHGLFQHTEEGKT